MNRNVKEQITDEKGIDIRFPSTANLMIDSTDRTSNTFANDFSIVPGQQLIPGAFTRAAVQEVTMFWGVPNISSQAGNVTFTINAPTAVDTYYLDISGDVSGNPAYYDPVEFDGGSVLRNPIIEVNGLPTTIYPDQLPLLDPAGAPIDINNAPMVGEVIALTFSSGFRTVAAVLQIIASTFTAASTGGFVTYTLSGSSFWGAVIRSTVTSTGASANITVANGTLAQQLGIQPLGSLTNNFYPFIPNIMPWRYVDIVCDQLTYCQDVKDATTNPTITKNVVYRWNFGWDDPPQNDIYGFPILQGYQPIMVRRSIAFPKQIKWDSLQTIANLTFKSFCSTGYQLLTAGRYIPVPIVGTGVGVNVPSSSYEFQMNLLLSEV
jgi:hypothetical protein